MARRNTRLVFFLVAAIAGPAAAQELNVYDDHDVWLIESSAQNSLEYARTNQTSVWENPDTGSSGAITPIQTYQNADGQYCREYRQTVTIGGREAQAYGTACRMPDGTWQVVSDKPADAPSPAVVYQERVVVEPVYAPAPPYYSRWDPILYTTYAAVLPLALDIGLSYWDDYYWRGYNGRYYRGGYYSGGHYRGGHYRGGHRGAYYRGGHYRGGHRGAYYRGGRRGGSWRGGHSGGGRAVAHRGGGRGGGRAVAHRGGGRGGRRR
jgi:surface antigen